MSSTTNRFYQSGTGLIAIDHQDRKVVLGFRGSIIQTGYFTDILYHQRGYSSVAGMDYQYLGHDPMAITYGQLRMGDINFSQWADKIFHTKKFSKAIDKGGEIPYESFSRAIYDS
jgi:hypothetical protein